MATFLDLPGVRISEVRLGAPPIAGVGTSTAAFVGKAPQANATIGKEPHLVTSVDQFFSEFIRDKADPDDETKGAKKSTALADAVIGFFQNGGTRCYVVDMASELPADVKTGIEKLAKIDDVNIIAAPGIADKDVYDALEKQATDILNRFAILDPPAAPVTTITDFNKTVIDTPTPGVRPVDSKFAAFYYPRIAVANVLKDDKDAKTQRFAAPSGHIAGLYAKTDGERGVHKAPANAALSGALGVEHKITDSEQDTLNPLGINIIRLFAEGPIVWGARTLDRVDTNFRYVSVRRLAGFIEDSLRRGLRFAVFEPNNLALRQTITRSVRGFLDGVWRDGALFGATADEAYYVRFPDPFNTDTDRALGKLTLEVGLRVAPPAEFIIIRIGLLDRAANAA